MRDSRPKLDGAHFLGIDCGTQGTKALLLRGDGTVLGRGYARHDLVERATGAREQDPQWWFDAMRDAVRAAISSQPTRPIHAIGISGQQHGLVILDDEQRVIRPAKLWNDTETAAENDELVQHFGGKQAWLERFSIVPLTGYTVSKLLWVRRHEPQNFARICHILLPHEYLNYRLTGEFGAEAGDASGTGYFDIQSRSWIREVLDFIDGGTGQLFAALPQLLGEDAPAGTLTPAAALELGIDAGCLVSAGGGDNMMGAIATGNVREGVVTMSLGTSSTVYSYRTRPVIETTGSVAPFCASSGGCLPLVCTMNATNVVTSTLEMIGRTVAFIDDALRGTPPGADGLTFLPFLNGERTPDLPRATGTLVGVNSTNYTPEHLVRAAVEGVSFGILHGLDLILQGSPAERIAVIGGGARSAGWRQLLADSTGALLQVPAEEEAGCLGAAIQSIRCWSMSEAPLTYTELTGRYVRFNEAQTAHPDPAQRSIYAAARERYRRSLHALYPESR